MSSFDGKNSNRRQFVGLTLAITFVAAGLGGCQVRPLYGSLDTTNGSSSVPDELAAIEIDTISKRHANANAIRTLYNELTFRFERGASRPPKRFQLKVLADLNEAEVGVEQLADVPAAYTMTMNSTFVLSNIATNTTMMTGKSFATASYDFSDQRFANLRAKRDAEERAAKAIAQDIQARIAGYFASQS